MKAMRKFGKQDQRSLAIWAVDCALRYLPFFEKAYPNDKRPRIAIKVCLEWIETQKFRMKTIRKASLDSHAAARKAKKNPTACFAARAAGQAVATAHVPEHAFGAAYYGLKIAAEKNPKNLKSAIKKELEWQTKTLPKSLREDWLNWQKQRLPRYLKHTEIP